MKPEKTKSDSTKEGYLTFDAKKIIFTKDGSDEIYKARLGITNSLVEHVAIKVKTNASKVYTVRPNALKLAPFATVHLAISSNLSVVEVRPI